MAGKLKIIKDELLRQLKIISISFNVIVNLLYIGYLYFAIKQEIGNKYVNMTLAIATALFLLIYLILRLFKNDKKNLKRTKKVYKRIKLLTKVFTVGTAVYTVSIAVGSVSPLATLFAIVNAILLGIRLIFELILSLITRSVGKVKSSVIEKRLNRKRPNLETDMSFVPDEVFDVEITVDDLK